MATKPKFAATTPEQLNELQARLAEVEETLRAIRHGEVDAVVVSTTEGDRVFTLEGADHPYRVMVETINEGAATLTANGLVLYANRRFADMVGIPLENLIGSRLPDVVRTLLPTLKCPTLEELLERALRAPQTEECSLVTGDGKPLPVQLSLSPLKGGDFQGICLLATDLSEQKRREEDLAKSNEILRSEIAERKRVEDTLHHTEAVFQAFMNHNPAVVFVKDEGGRYAFCNKTLAQLYGMPAEDLVGKSTSELVPAETAHMIVEHDRAVLSKGAPIEYVETLTLPHGGPREFLTVRFPFRDPSGRNLIGGVALDMSAQRRAEATLRQLTGRVLNLQDEERRRIARDLHDSTAQTLSALALNLGLMQTRGEVHGGTPMSKLLEQSLTLAEQASNELRNLSHLLHPPDLDRIGLIAAIEWHSRRFGEMSGLEISLDLPTHMERLSEDVEIALFRVLQESLVNVQRHSGSSVAEIRLVPQEAQVILEVKDKGRGAPPGLLTNSAGNLTHLGIGIVGMQERLRQLGGRLEIDSSSHGTTVRAIVPLPRSAQDGGWTPPAGPPQQP